MKNKTNKSKRKRLSQTKSGLIKRARIGLQHLRSRKSRRQKKNSKQKLQTINATDKNLMLK